MGHRRVQGGAPGVQLGLIITPMLDMSFQILAFFIMTYHPSALEAHVPGSLVPPEDIAKKSKDSTPAPPTETPPTSSLEEEILPELQEAITLRAKAVVKGQEGVRTVGMLSQLLLKTTLETEAQLIADVDVDDDRAMKLLEAKLKDMVRKGSTNKAHVKLAADGELRQRYVMKIYDTCKKAGFANIHFVPPPVLNVKLK